MERTYGALWLREGLAVHLSNRLSRWPVFMRLEGNLIELNPKSTEDLARARLTTAAGQQAWSLVGGNGVPTLGSGDVRTLFYVLSGSFVAFVDQQVGTPALMSLYRSSDVPAAFMKLTGHSVADWKAAWLERRQNTVTGCLDGPQFLHYIRLAGAGEIGSGERDSASNGRRGD